MQSRASHVNQNGTMAAPPIRMQDQRWQGHIADCNGSIEQIGARAERYNSPAENLAAHQRTTVEEKRQYEHRATREKVLEQFRVRVKERVKRRERCKRTLVQNGLLPNTECGDSAAIIGESVLSLSSSDDVTIVAERSRTKDDACKQLAIYCCTGQIEEQSTSSADTSSIMSANTVSSQQQLDKRSMIEQGSRPMDTVLTTHTLNELNRLQRGDKVSMTHRFYSQRERQQSREWVVQQQQRHQAWLHREARELERRLLEGREEKSKVQDKAVKQWAQSVEEQQKRSEQHAIELKRYCEALYQQRRRKQYRSPSPPPSLCLCHSSLWECNPVSCAANCAYRLDHSAYNRALHSFLHSLNT